MIRYPFAKTSALWFASIAFLVSSEWLFQITKPSFLSRYSLLHNCELALLAILGLNILILPFLGFCLGVAHHQRKAIVRVILLGIPSGLLALSLLLMFDNLTHTVFGFNMGAVPGWWRLTYLFLLLAMAADILKKLEHLVLIPWPKAAARCLQMTAGVVLLLTIIILPGRLNIFIPDPGLPVVTQKGPRPNILILSTDGLRAANMSSYGYYRQTTPFIDSLSNETLRFKGHFVNASHTTGSVMALLSGQLPTRSKVIYRPDIFRGVDAFRNLPGILRSIGYRTMDVSLEYYADPFDLNMRGAFDSANFRSEREKQFASSLPITWQVRFDGEIYFLEQFAKRLIGRLAHMTGIRDLGNPYFVVTHTGTENRLDEKILYRAERLMGNSPQPFFLHVHLLGTHGPKFGPPRRIFSMGKSQDQEWMDDFYDDAILSFDGYVAKLFAHMKAEALLDNTLIILTSDHGQQFTLWQAVPMIIRFPGGARSGLVNNPSQQIDVAPTILDYLRVPVPSWMDGKSLLNVAGQRTEPIIGVIPGKLSQATNGWRETEHYRPPFYSLGTLSIIVDNTWYGLALEENAIFYHHTDSENDSATGSNLLSETEARQIIVNQLKANGYDLDLLPGNELSETPKPL
ncbi:MAG: hypothetical protein BA871_16920 [Desulfuromonadales bacterium C00003096]|jgi:arylsulfatase A-like enzyme|nr:MAG: hypothetical protein BA871_16920 [Desulfuromonadales bacterium C00003096]